MISKGNIMLTVDEYERRLLVTALTEFRNNLIWAKRPTETVDKIILKIMDDQIEKKREEHEER